MTFSQQVITRYLYKIQETHRNRKFSGPSVQDKAVRGVLNPSGQCGTIPGFLPSVRVENQKQQTHDELPFARSPCRPIFMLIMRDRASMHTCQDPKRTCPWANLLSVKARSIQRWCPQRPPGSQIPDTVSTSLRKGGFSRSPFLQRCTHMKRCPDHLMRARPPRDTHERPVGYRHPTWTVAAARTTTRLWIRWVAHAFVPRM